MGSPQKARDGLHPAAMHSGGEGVAGALAASLPPQLLGFLEACARLAAEEGWRLYLVGGCVRDLLLSRAHNDLDLAVEGDAISLARLLQAHGLAQVEVAHRFGTAYLQTAEGLPNIDLVTARRETYPHPGALPVTEPGTILDDLARRDFTVNSLSIPIDSHGPGDLLDPHGGLSDLWARLIRVHHSRSFLDDPTRIPRAVKYALRLGFEIEPETRRLLDDATSSGALDTVSMDRKARELLLMMQEPRAGKMLAALEKMGVLRAIADSLSWPYAPGSAVVPAEEAPLRPTERRDTFLALLGWQHAREPERAEALARTLGLGAHLARIVADSARLGQRWAALDAAGLKPHEAHDMLAGLYHGAIEAASRIPALRAQSAAFARLERFLGGENRLPSLGGDYLKSLGVPPGPLYRAALDALRRAKLDGKLPGVEEEKRFLAEWLAGDGGVRGE